MTESENHFFGFQATLTQIFAAHHASSLTQLSDSKLGHSLIP